MIAEFTIPGLPQSQGSMRAFVVKGKAVVTSDNPNLRAWRADARTIAADHCTLAPKGTRVRIDVTFYMKRPAGHYGSGKNAKKIRASAPVQPVTKPDLDKLCRSLLDALTGVAYEDDAQVCDLSMRKVWPWEGQRTGTCVRVETLP